MTDCFARNRGAIWDNNTNDFNEYFLEDELIPLRLYRRIFDRMVLKSHTDMLVATTPYARLPTTIMAGSFLRSTPSSKSTFTTEYNER